MTGRLRVFLSSLFLLHYTARQYVRHVVPPPPPIQLTQHYRLRAGRVFVCQSGCKSSHLVSGHNF